jgi:hypothetical protein
MLKVIHDTNTRREDTKQSRLREERTAVPGATRKPGPASPRASTPCMATGFASMTPRCEELVDISTMI